MEELMRLLRYTKWADERLIQAAEFLSAEGYAKDLGSSFPSVQATLTHLFGADRTWLMRVQGETPEWAQPADYPDPATLWRDWQKVLGAWPLTVQGVGDAAKVISYRTFDGTPYKTPVDDIVRHVVNHGSYHRGQVVTMLRQLGVSAPATDLIAFYRTG